MGRSSPTPTRIQSTKFNDCTNFKCRYAIINEKGLPVMGNIPQISNYQMRDPLDTDDYFCDVAQGNCHMFILSNHGRVFSIGKNIYGQCVCDFGFLTTRVFPNVLDSTHFVK
jgi:alpha-tubulin suppressor-like RCC1 family protein